ncbi:unnamed protein product [Effrenium voratum]|uniref:Membrane insertase YidC/Oxa/ALB C-terminal domain-containing protein n=1 Tax=Effrenium voratum TaxID=2562239 RepID=A0AA36MW01_9DINO|nr:unnamed protein product [Effrenium voratum]
MRRKAALVAALALGGRLFVAPSGGGAFRRPRRGASSGAARRSALPEVWDWVPHFQLVDPAWAGDWQMPLPELDPNAQYLYGADGEVLRDPSSKKPLTDDWFNAAVGFQAEIVRGIDQALRSVGVPQAFGWTIFLWTFIFKLLLYPLEKDTLRSSAMTKMIAPKLQQIKEKYKDDEEMVTKRTMRLYDIFGISVFGGCLPLLIQLPMIFTLFYCWRRLAAEKYEHYYDGWLWIPSLSQPNPNFDYKLDWLLQFNEAGPAIGWDIWVRQLILPALVIYVAWLKNQEPGSPADTPKKDDKKNPVVSNLPLLLTAWLTVELPQIMSVYYLALNLVGFLEIEIVKVQIREELPVFEVFERTGRFPEGNFDETFFPESLHQASRNGNLPAVQLLLDEGVDVNALDEADTPALCYAALQGHSRVVVLLCLSGANILAANKEKSNALHFAAATDQVEVLKFLVSYGKANYKEFDQDAWLEMRTAQGLTIRDLAEKVAREEGHRQVLEFLQELEQAPSAPTPVLAEAAAVTSARAVD